MRESESALPEAGGKPPPRTAAVPVEHGGVFRSSMAWFLGVLAVTVLTAPVVGEWRYGTLVEAILMSFVLLSGVLAVGDGRRHLVWGVALVLPALAARWAEHAWPGLTPSTLVPASAMASLVFVINCLLRLLFRAKRVTSQVLCAGMAVYLLLGLLWGFAYVGAERLVPGSFSFSSGSKQTLEAFGALYLSFITLTTVGYGDITPVSGLARSLAMAESTTGTMYVAVLLSRLVALYSSAGPDSGGSGP